MSKLGTIARRTFIVGSTAIAGGVAFGYYSYKKPLPNPLMENLGDGAAALTPYVLITPRGITLITPRADKGQGSYSIQAHLLAEELDVDPHKVQLDPGKPSAAYYNSLVMTEGFPFASTDESFLARTMRSSSDVITRLMGLQITGGSTTVPEGQEKLRLAGAVARETLKEAAAIQSGIDKSKLTTKDGAVLLPDGKQLSYVELAPIAAKLDPPQDVPLRDPATWRYLGKKMQRTDIIPKSIGKQTYGIDFHMENILFASVKTNPGLGGEITRLDASKAQKMRGVKKIVPVKGGIGVIADNTWRAFQALNAIECEWGPAPYPASSAEMWQEVAASFTDERQDNRFKDQGDVEKALAEGETLQAEYRIPYLAHAPLEPMNAVVLYDGERLDILTGTQIPRFIEDHAAELTGLDKSNIHVHVLMMGGSFGRRLEDTYVMQAIELAMAVQGQPVKMTWSREEDMTHDYPRPMQMSRAAGTIKDGKIESYDLSIASASVASSWFGRLMSPPPGPDITIVSGAWDQPFDIPHYRVTGYRVPEMVPISSWRSVGASGNGFLHDCFIDELIHAASADPLQERLRLCNHEVSRTVLKTVGTMSDWGKELGPNRGRGLAFVLSFGVPVAQVVEVTATDKGIRIDKVFVAMDVGTVMDPVNFENQVQGGVIWGLGHAMNAELTYENYAPQQTNYHNYAGMRLYQTPEIHIKGLENGQEIRGAGEPSVPPTAPALANAIFAATGQRIRELPLNKHIDFV